MKKSIVFLVFVFLGLMVYAQKPVYNRFYVIQNKKSGKFIEIADASTLNGAKIIQSSYTGAKSQCFKMVELTGGFRLSSIVSGKCFDIPNATNTPNTQLTQYDCYPTDPQRFNIDLVGVDGYVKITMAKNGLVLGIRNGSLADGGILELEVLTNSDSQLWKFTEISPYGHVNGIVASQIGYKPGDAKKGVLLLKDNLVKDGTYQVATVFSVVNVETNKVVYTGPLTRYGLKWESQTYTLDFSNLKDPGTYQLTAGTFKSYPFVISETIWKVNTRHEEYFTSFFAYQRATTEIVLRDDEDETTINAYIQKGKELYVPQGVTRDVQFGWFSATSHDKHVNEQSVAIEALLYAYFYNPDFFKNKQVNVVPAVIDEVRFSFEFLLRMQDEDGGFMSSVHPGAFSWDGPGIPKHRYLVANKGTGTTARGTGALVLGYIALKEYDSEYAQTLLNGARKGFGWLNKHPNEYIPDSIRPYWWKPGFFDSWLRASVDMYIATKDDYPAEAAVYKKFVEEHIKSGFMNTNGVWNSGGAGLDYDYSPYWTPDQTTHGVIVYALARYYPYAAVSTQTKIKVDLTTFANYWKKPTRFNHPYGWADNLMVPWFGFCGGFADAAPKLLFAGYFLNDQALIKIGKDHIQALLGVNPLGTTYIYGEGTKTFDDLFNRPSDGSVGAVPPGMRETDDAYNIPYDNYRLGGPDYSTGEASISQTPSVLFALALMDKESLVNYTSVVGSVKAVLDDYVVFPNPAKSGENILISKKRMVEGNENVNIYLYDLSGKIIYKNNISQSNTKYELGINNLIKGIYIIQIVDESNKIFTGKLVVI